jgi:hypothetical protein
VGKPVAKLRFKLNYEKMGDCWNSESTSVSGVGSSHLTTMMAANYYFPHRNIIAIRSLGLESSKRAPQEYYILTVSRDYQFRARVTAFINEAATDQN